MKRNPRKMRWTKAFRKATGKEMTVDATFEFEKRRNVPVRYDRELMDTTIKAIKRVQEIKAKRERLHYRNRVKGKMEKEMGQTIKQVETGMDLLSAPVIRKKQTIKITNAPAERHMEIE